MLLLRGFAACLIYYFFMGGIRRSGLEVSLKTGFKCLMNCDLAVMIVIDHVAGRSFMVAAVLFCRRTYVRESRGLRYVEKIGKRHLASPRLSRSCMNMPCMPYMWSTLHSSESMVRKRYCVGV